MRIDRLIPSMFHRRLLLLFAAVGIMLSVLGGRLAVLTVAQGAEHREAAERALLRTRWIPTVRGDILDREGRVLATDRPSFNIAVDYDLITGQWAVDRATADARNADRERWLELDVAGRERLVAERLPEHERELERIWATMAATAQVSRDVIEERKAEVLEEVQRIAASVWERALEQKRREAYEKGREPSVVLADVARPIREQRQAHAILRAVDDETAFRFRLLAQEAPEIHVLDAGSRDYPGETATVTIDLSTLPGPLREERSAEVVVTGVATQLVGWMRSEVQAEDRQRRPMIDEETGEVDRGFYMLGDRVGQWGAEAGFEDRLRGLRGRSVQHLDTGLIEEVPNERGRDVRLTIDIALQARIQALMSPELGLARVQPFHGGKSLLPEGTPLHGAAVVLDVETGHVLAMVSTPTFTREQAQKDPDWVFRDPVDLPWLNRAIDAKYTPGSIVKPLMLVGAVTDREFGQGRAVECTGHFLPNRNDVYRCWIYKQYGTTHTAQLGHDLQAREAIAVSCNIFFYTVARSLGPEGVAKWFRAFGVGAGWGLGVGHEQGGDVGPANREISQSDAVHMGIGQGPVSWSPLHAADAYATLAREGLRMTPRIDIDAPAAAQDLRLDPSAVRDALAGLLDAANDRLGTGATLTYDDGTREPMFNVPGVDVVGKTGTAEAPDIRVEGETLREGDHSWYVALAGPAGRPPRYAIAVVMEYAGSGGRVSGPVCNQIVHALVAEGYLEGGSAPRADATGGRAP